MPVLAGCSAVLFVHGSSISGTQTFDLQIPGRPECSAMDTFARRGYDVWCVDCEGYGRSDKSRPTVHLGLSGCKAARVKCVDHHEAARAPTALAVA